MPFLLQSWPHTFYKLVLAYHITLTTKLYEAVIFNLPMNIHGRLYPKVANLSKGILITRNMPNNVKID